jgi:hypothetical protein
MTEIEDIYLRAKTAEAQCRDMMAERDEARRETEYESELVADAKGEVMRWIELHCAACDERDEAREAITLLDRDVFNLDAALKKAEAEVKRLRVALEPFALQNDNLEDFVTDKGAYPVFFSVKQIEAARAALKENEHAQTGDQK